MMKKVCRPLQEKDIDKLEKVTDKIEKLKATILKAQKELNAIKDEHSWLNYLGKGSDANLTQEERFRLGDACEIINYCNRD